MTLHEIMGQFDQMTCEARKQIAGGGDCREYAIGIANAAAKLGAQNMEHMAEVFTEGERRIMEIIKLGAAYKQSQGKGKRDTEAAEADTTEKINMDNVVKLEIGLTLEPDVWLKAADDLEKVFPYMAKILLRRNYEGLGKKDAADFMAEASLALTALRYVGNFAADKCRFIGI